MDRQPELLTLQRLERRRGETWQGLWLAPLLTVVGQGFLLIVLADEAVGWLGRAAVLAAALAANLAALWSVLRAHAREVQYSEAIDAELEATADGDYADVRAAALARPRRRAAAVAAVAAEPEDLDQPDQTEDPEEAADPDEAETRVAPLDPPNAAFPSHPGHRRGRAARGLGRALGSPPHLVGGRRDPCQVLHGLVRGAGGLRARRRRRLPEHGLSRAKRAGRIPGPTGPPKHYRWQR